MESNIGRTVQLTIPVDDPEELAALEQALLRARATELAEVRRNQVRLGAGYGDDTTRDTMTDQQRLAERRRTMLDRVLAAVRAASDTSGR